MFDASPFLDRDCTSAAILITILLGWWIAAKIAGMGPKQQGPVIRDKYYRIPGYHHEEEK